MRWLWGRLRHRRCRAEVAGPRFSGTLTQVVGGSLVVISRAGVPVPEVPPMRPVCRPGRGALRGRIRLPATFDDPRGGIAEAFGVR